MITQGVVYRGKISSDVLVYVEKVKENINTVIGLPFLSKSGNPVARLSYRYDDFLNYYEETELAYTRVSFKMSEGEVVAFLLDCPANKNAVLSYMHVGQHGEASMEFYRECKPATPEQYKSLCAELVSIGYLVHIKDSDDSSKEFKDGWI